MMLLNLPLQTLHVLLLEDRQLCVTGAAHAAARRILDAFPNHLLLQALHMLFTGGVHDAVA